MSPGGSDRSRPLWLPRRRALALGVGSAVAGLAGCVGAPGNGSDDGDDGDGEIADPPERGRVAAGPTTDVDLPVAEDDLTRGAPRDAIPAIVDPAFGAR